MLGRRAAVHVSSTSSTGLTRKQQTEVVFAAVASLSPRQRRLVLETYGLPLDDEAKAAVVPTGVLRDAALKAALGRLRGELEA